MKERCITIGKMFGVLFVSTIFGALLLTFMYSLPTDKIIDNVNNSLDIYKHELDKPHWAGGTHGSSVQGYSSIHTNLDNFTDAVMLLKAMYPVEDNAFGELLRDLKATGSVEDHAFMAMLLNPSWHMVNVSPIHTLIFAKEDPLKIDSNSVDTYGFYWHGYLTILKPALMFAPVQDLRVLNLYIQMILMATALILIYRRLGLCEMYAFLLVIATINPVTTAMNFQNSDIFYIMLLATIFILWKNEFLLRGKNYLYFFLIIGIVTTYFDFLTYPITGLGIPLCICVMMNKEIFFNVSLKKTFTKLSSYIFAWGFGYFGMWIGKWAVMYVAAKVYGLKKLSEIFYAAIEHTLYRFSTTLPPEDGGNTFNPLEVFQRNFDALMNNPFPILLGLCAIALLYMLIMHRKNFRPTRGILVTFGVIALLPFIWYAVVKNHSWIHAYMTYRNLTIPLFSLSCFFIASLKKSEEN